MKDKRKQTIAVAIASTLSVTTLSDPFLVFAQERKESDTTQEIYTGDATPQQTYTQDAQPMEALSQTTGTIGITSNKEIEINEVNFPDQRFRDYVKDKLDDGNGSLTQSEIDQITIINLSFLGDIETKKIKSLKGIEHFTELTSLNCYGTDISALDVSQNKKLELLNCGGTGIRNLNVSNNLLLKTLYCHYTDIESLNLENNTALETLFCSNAKLKSLNIDNNVALKELYCNNTNIKSLNLSNNDVLKVLDCHSTEVTSLDVSNNVYLHSLYCSYTEITALDISNNVYLERLDCSNTKITSLDVSNSPDLYELHCQDTPLAWLNLGADTQLEGYDSIDSFIMSDSEFNLIVRGSTFDVTEVFKGIDISKIKQDTIKGAKLTGKMMSDYTVGTPITYEYDCGNTKRQNKTLKVTVNLVKGDSEIVITNDLDTVYTGKPILDPQVTTIGSQGIVVFHYEVYDGNGWVPIVGKPVNAGTYRVKAQLPEDELNLKADNTKEFTISKAIPSYHLPTNLTAVYGQQLSEISLPAGFQWKDSMLSVGDVGKHEFLLDYTPSDTNNYEIVTDLKVQVDVKQAANEWITKPTIKDWTYGEQANKPSTSAKYGDVVYTYSESKDGTYTSTVPSNAGTYYVKAMVPETNNYTALETITEFTIKQATNEWITKPTMKDWIYGEQANKPSASAKYGDVVYTYSESKDGIYTSTVPSNAGTYYVKAMVKGTTDYTGLEELQLFTIQPKQASNLIISDIANDKDVEHLIVKDHEQVLRKNIDYDVKTMKDQKIVTVSITFKGNYTGTITKTYTVESANKIEPVSKTETLSKAERKESVPTGDATQGGMLGFLSIVSASCIAYITGKNKKGKHHIE